MAQETANHSEDFVFGLDIGTRNVVGTVGKLTEEGFHVIAQATMEHETRAMLDGQIHDIGRVAKVIRLVKKTLEEQIEFPLTDVCIAAAGRVLRTITTRVKYEYSEEAVVSEEDIHTLDLMGIDQAQTMLKEQSDEKYKFYCVGYSVMRYFLNGDLISNLEGHKAEEIAEDIIVTFLPEDVVDGLYSAVERADLKVANLTLEPIAAINVAIPENFRLLNIALIDVGAGTSDICITRDGSIIAYGMIPYAGDELTEVIVQEYLVDFAMAEKIKIESSEKEEITYEDIMGISHTLKAEDIWKLTEEVRNKIAAEVASKICELNGDKTVSAAFVVGGGGKIHGFCEALAKDLQLAKERVALRGEEVMKNVTFEQEEIKKDPLLVTPIGICMNYYEQKNNFIMLHFNDEMMKLYDNGHLTIVDAALQAGYSTEELFPRRGRELHFTVNGIKRMVRGSEGESAKVYMNDELVGLSAKLLPNSHITISPSTAGKDAKSTIADLKEYTADTITFVVNHHYVSCPKFVEVNGSLEPGTYEIMEGDAIELRNYYTVGQLRTFMDVELDEDGDILVNNRPAGTETLVYENFNVEWPVIAFGSMDGSYTSIEEAEKEEQKNDESEPLPAEDHAEVAAAEYQETEEKEDNTVFETETAMEPKPVSAEECDLHITVNQEQKTLTGKKEYIFVDIFNVIAFNPGDGAGKRVVTKINGNTCEFADPLHEGDAIAIGWEE